MFAFDPRGTGSFLSRAVNGRQYDMMFGTEYKLGCDARMLGRPLAGNANSVTINLIEPQTLFGDRINQVDFRIAKVLRFGRTRTQVGVDIFNLMNSNVALGYLQTFGATWLRPTTVMDARFARVSGQIDF